MEKIFVRVLTLPSAERQQMRTAAQPSHRCSFGHNSIFKHASKRSSSGMRFRALCRRFHPSWRRCLSYGAVFFNLFAATEPSANVCIHCSWNPMQWSKCLHWYKRLELWSRISSQAISVCFGGNLRFVSFRAHCGNGREEVKCIFFTCKPLLRKCSRSERLRYRPSPVMLSCRNNLS